MERMLSTELMYMCSPPKVQSAGTNVTNKKLHLSVAPQDIPMSGIYHGGENPQCIW